MKIVEVVQFLSRIEDVEYIPNVIDSITNMMAIVDESIKDDELRINLRMVIDDVWLSNSIDKNRVFELIGLFADNNEEEDTDILHLISILSNIKSNDAYYYIDNTTGKIYTFNKELFVKIKDEIVKKLDFYFRYEVDIKEDEFQ